VALAAVYVALNLYSLDHRVLERGLAAGWSQTDVPNGAERSLAAAATALFPIFILAWGIRSRRTLLLDLGVLCAALSLATLRFYVHLAPLWAVLSVAGAGLLGLALGLNRWLVRSPRGERGGFTPEPLFEDEEKQKTLAVLGAVPLVPAARTPAPEPGKFEGGGGSFGGAGSSGTF